VRSALCLGVSRQICSVYSCNLRRGPASSPSWQLQRRIAITLLIAWDCVGLCILFQLRRTWRNMCGRWFSGCSKLPHGIGSISCDQWPQRVHMTNFLPLSAPVFSWTRRTRCLSHRLRQCDNLHYLHYTINHLIKG
jgi:hypothetical protein